MTPAEIPPVAVDTNMLFSALLQPGNRFLAVLSRRGSIYVTETVLTELYRHKEKLLQVSKVGEADVIETYHNLITWIDLYKETRIPRSCWDEAHALCHDVDPGDTVHVALALALDGLLWTGDKRLRDGLLAKGFDRFFVPGSRPLGCCRSALDAGPGCGSVAPGLVDPHWNGGCCLSPVLMANLGRARWMMYDRGYGWHGGWEMRMEHGDHGYDRGYRDPRQGRGGPTERPWVGGYRDGYQGGSGGYAVGTSGPLYDTRGYADDYHERGYRRPAGARPMNDRGTVRMRGSARDLDPSFGRGEHGDTFAYNDERGGTGFGGQGRMAGGGGFGGRYGREYDRGMRGYAREFQNEGRPEGYHPRYSPVGGTYAPMGGSSAAGRLPRPLQDARWTSERTR